MIETLLLFGASGDLAGRLLLPALAWLEEQGQLPEGFRATGTSRERWDDAAFRQHTAGQLAEHAAGVPQDARDRLVERFSYRFSDVTNRDSVTGIVRELAANGTPIAAYLALPQGLFPAALDALEAAMLPAGSRIVVEKPFGNDQKSAVELNEMLSRAGASAGPHASFRVDHVLGMSTIQNLLVLRSANPMLDAVLNSTYVEQVDVLWDETLTLEGRAGFYDKAGALKDVMQNHMTQLLCYVAMEPPARLDSDELSDRKVELLHAVRTLAPDEMASRTRRGRYTAGRVEDRDIPAYVDGEGVDPQRNTETLAEVVLDIDNDRWRGTPFVMHTAKAMPKRWKGIILRFRPAAQHPFGDDALPASELRIGIDDPTDISLHLIGGVNEPSLRPSSIAMTSPSLALDVPPYSNVLMDILSGGSSLSVRGDEAEEAWRIFDPVIRAWAENIVPMEQYPAGSPGLPPREPASK